LPSNSLQFVDFLNANGKPTPGLVPVNPERSGSQPDGISEMAVIHDAQFFDRIDYVFFRRFTDGRSSQVAAYVVDNSNEKLSKDHLAELHSKVWLQGLAPLLYVSRPSQVDVLTCARKPDFLTDGDEKYEYNPIDTISEISDELNKFSAFHLADGTFWEDQDNKVYANYKKAAHQFLIQAVQEADSTLNGKDKPIVRRLLIIILLVKYLEDRGVIPEVFFDEIHRGAKSFLDVLETQEPEIVFDLLEKLEDRFNGDIFKLSNDEEQRITKEILKEFATLIEGKTLRNQRNLWKLFSFKHLPVEIISHLYQRFVPKGKGAVYTPPILAALLLDQTMPYNKLTGNERVLDPACGSGVFLVGAFKRLINVWRSNNGWECKDVNKLKNVLKDCVYGIDLDPTALRLTSFSLSLAICDALQPDIIWNELIFDTLLTSNLFQSDFFQILNDSRNGTRTILNKEFDIIIGNPPFKSELTSAGKIVEEKEKQNDENYIRLPDNQIAYQFLKQALTILRPKGKCCLIQPSGFVYNTNTKDFRTVIFNNYRVETIYDFVSIRGLFEDADTKVIAILVHTETPTENHWVNHWTFRRTRSIKERICFELDHYDRHRVTQDQAETSFIWKVNLLGGGRLLNICQRLRTMRILAKYIKEKKWDYGEGFIAGKKGNLKPASHITGLPLLPTEALSESGIDETQIRRVNEKLFISVPPKERFTAPLLLLKEHASLPVAYLENGLLAFKDKIVGIHARSKEEDKLSSLYRTLSCNRDFYRFFCALNSTQYLVVKATAILKQDIDLFPYPEDLSDLDFTYWEKVLRDDVLDYMTEYVRLGQKSDLLIKEATENDTQSYAKLFVKMLGTIYDNLKASKAIFLDGLICQPFYFGDRPNLSCIEQQDTEGLKKLIFEERNHSYLRNIRILRYYDKNVLLIIKPDRLRYWIRSTAIRDADETLVDLYKQGF
jgi:type I restriction-modification system DNA methylase subunit